MKKKKILKKIIAIAIPVGTPLLVAMIIASGAYAVFAFVAAFFANLFGSSETADISTVTIEQMISAVSNEYIIPDAVLDAMMIDRDSLKLLLVKTKEFNDSYDTDTKQLGTIHKWCNKKYKTGEDGEEVFDGWTEPPEENKDVDFVDHNVTTETYEGAYRLDWQTVVMVAIFDSLQRYKETIDPTLQDSVVDEDTNDGDTGEEEERHHGRYDTTQYVVSTIDTITEIGKYNPKTDFDDSFDEAAAETGLPVGLIKAIAYTESRFQPDAVHKLEHGECIGIMQLNSTFFASSEEEKQKLYDPDYNIKKGSQYIADLIRNKMNGNVVLGLTAYNWGESQSFLKDGSIKEKHLKYAASVLSTYTQKKITAKSLLNAKDTDYTIQLRGFGSFNTATRRMHYSEDEIDRLIDDLRPKFYYEYDYVRDKKKKFLYDECKDMANSGRKSEGSVHSDTGQHIWHEPISVLKKVELPYADIEFSNNTPVSYVKNERRWLALMSHYCPYYEDKWFWGLVERLPRGDEVVASVDYIFGLASGTMEYGGDYLKSSLTAEEIDSICEQVTDETRRKVVRYALEHVGYPYSQDLRWTERYYDCSSFAYFSWKAGGIDISYKGDTTAAGEALGMEVNGKTIRIEKIKPGDLLFYWRKDAQAKGRHKGIGHVAVYIGNGMMADARGKKWGVVYREMTTKDLRVVADPLRNTHTGNEQVQ